MAKKIIRNSELVNQLLDVGIVPDHCRRIVIDIQADNTVTLYFECVGDERLLQIDWAKGLTISRVDELLKQAQEQEDKNNG